MPSVEDTRIGAPEASAVGRSPLPAGFFYYLPQVNGVNGGDISQLTAGYCHFGFCRVSVCPRYK